MKIAVIGLGKTGQSHLEAWSEIEAVKVTGVVGEDSDSLQDSVRKKGFSFYRDLENLLLQAKVDAVDICVPASLQAELVFQAAKAGKHVICSSSPDVDVENIKKMDKMCNQHGVQLLTGHLLRFTPAYADAHEQVKKGVIGKPGVIRLSKSMPFPEEENESSFLMLGADEFDWLRWTFGEVKRVMAKTVKRSGNEGDSIEYALITLRMADGTICHMELSRPAIPFETAFELSGDGGMITYNSRESSPLKLQHSKDESLFSPLGTSPCKRQLEHFVRCVSDRERPLPSINDTLKAKEIAYAVARSADEGQPVSLAEGSGIE
ncbi:MAG TPA: Gfo/Idh/MocA family oxidoreductase [Bacillales bacterium]|nr:Gfo/Idh/MocA family oxidoreductase [Bacillales bacterium]